MNSTTHPNGMAIGELHSNSTDSTGEELDSAVRKITRRILPVFFCMFIVNYIDRVNIGFVRPYLETDLGIGPAAFGLGAGLYFIAYALFEVPANLLLKRLGARTCLTRIMLSWGVVSAGTAFMQNETQFYIFRFLLGVAEAGFFPGVIYYFTRWLPAAARGRAMAIFLAGSATASIISGPLTGALLEIHGLGLRGWQWMMLIEGSLSILLGALAWFLIDSEPGQARWLSAAEKKSILDTIAMEQRQREQHQTRAPSIWRIFIEPQILLCCSIFFCINLTIYAATFWLPTIVRSLGSLSDLQTGLISSIPWLIAVFAMYAFALLASRWRNQPAWLASALLIAGLGGLLASSGGPLTTFLALCFAAVGFKAASSLFWPIPQAYLDARIAAPALALINSLGNLGGFVAPLVFGLLQQRTGSVHGGFYLLAGTSFLAAILALFTRTR